MTELDPHQKIKKAAIIVGVIVIALGIILLLSWNFRKKNQQPIDATINAKSAVDPKIIEADQKEVFDKINETSQAEESKPISADEAVNKTRAVTNAVNQTDVAAPNIVDEEAAKRQEDLFDAINK